MGDGSDGRATLRDIFVAARADGLSAVELRLWLVVRSFESPDCFASTSTLSTYLDVSQSYVEKLRARLVADGWLQMHHRGPKEPRLKAVVPDEGLHSSEEQGLQQSEEQGEGLHQSAEQAAKALHKALHYSANRVRGVRKKERTPEVVAILEHLEELPAQDVELADRAIEAFASTRQRGKVAPSIVLSELEYWSDFSAGRVRTALRTYVEKEYASEGKDEKYLRGILRHTNEAPERRNGGPPESGPYYERP